MKNNYVITLLVLLGAFLFNSCIPQTQLAQSYKNYALLYNPNYSPLQPEYDLYQTTDTTAMLYVKIFRDNLLFKKISDQKAPVAQVKVRYLLNPSISNNQILDSASRKMIVEYRQNFNHYLIYFKIKTDTLKKAYLKVSVIDENWKRRNYAFFDIEKSDCGHKIDFLVSEKNLNSVHTNYLAAPNEYFVRNQRAQQKDLIISYFPKSDEVAAPPFAMGWTEVYEPKADSVFNYTLDKDTLRLDTSVLVHIKKNAQCQTGRTLVGVHRYFPRPTFAHELAENLIYLTSSAQYDSIRNSSNLKLAVDNFWLSTSKNKEQARNILKVYYNRVWFANKYFTTYKEGWKTDRGMVYIVLGPPPVIHKSEKSEKWQYTNAKNTEKIDFIFEKQKHPFTQEHYVLKRNITYKPIWFEAIETWRNGRIFTLD